MFLVDTNIRLEVFLKQEKAEESRKFLETVESALLAITEFSLYSIGIILTRFNKAALFTEFLSDIEESEIVKICLNINDLKEIPLLHHQFKLDFDDAYQYIASKKYDYTLISFDKDFDRTDRGKKLPNQALQEFGRVSGKNK